MKWGAMFQWKHTYGAKPGWSRNKCSQRPRASAGGFFKNLSTLKGGVPPFGVLEEEGGFGLERGLSGGDGGREGASLKDPVETASR